MRSKFDSFRLEWTRSFIGLKRDWPSVLLAVLSLAVATAISTAVFSVYDAVQLKALPVNDPGNLYVLNLEGPHGFSGGICLSDLVDLKRVEGVNSASISEPPNNYHLGNLDQDVVGQMVSSDYFRSLGVSLQVGRPPEGDQEAGVIISNDLWARLGHPVLGDLYLDLDKATLPVLGVAPKGFKGLPGENPISVWMSPKAYLSYDPQGESLLTGKTLRNSQGFLRISAASTPEKIRSSVSVLASRWAAEDPVGHGGKAFEERYRGSAQSLEFRPAINSIEAIRSGLFQNAIPFSTALIGISIVMLGLALTNIANLHYARSIEHRRDQAIRAALGAGGIEQGAKVIAEGLQVSLPSSILGLLLGLAGGRWLVQVSGMDVINVSPDGKVLIFTLLLPMAVAVGSSCLSMIRSARRDVLRDLTTVGLDLHGKRTQKVVLIVQATISTFLVSLALVWTAAVRHLSNQNLGYSPENLVMVSYDISHQDGMSINALRARASATQQAVLAGAGGIAGVTSFGQGWPAPMGTVQTEVCGNGLSADLVMVSNGWFETMGARLLQGRIFLASDISDRPHLVVVSRTLADRFWPSGNAVGQMLQMKGSSLEVIGVVADLKMRSPDTRAFPTAFVLGAPFRQVLALRSQGGANRIANEARLLVHSIDPASKVGIEYPSIQIKEFLAPRRVTEFLLFLSAVVSIVIFAVGVFGTQRLVVASRTKEFGIKSALGATPDIILKSVLKESVLVSAIGVVIGGLLSITGEAILRSHFSGMPSFSVGSLLVALIGGLILVLSVLATWEPAHSAASTDPMRAIRME